MEQDKIRVTRKFTFDMAHALFGYDGDCKNIHGHTYHLSVTLSGRPMRNSGHPKDGMLVDFKDLKTLVKSKVIDRFDHALTLNGNSPHRDLHSLKEQFGRIVMLPFQPTCENLLLDIRNSLQTEFNGNVKLCALRLDETPQSFAEWFLSDN